MTQMILEGMALPEASFDKYACWEDVLSVKVEMITGRMVTEVRGKVWRAKWSYDYLDNETTRSILSVLRSGSPIQAAVLPDNSNQMISGRFLAESVTPPTFLISDGGEPVWHGLAFTIREVNPHG